MQRIAGQVYFSATDLSHFADCQHLTWLDRLNLDEKMDKTPTDEHAKLIQAKGYEHEAAYLDTLRASAVSIVEIPKDASTEKLTAIAQTRAAIHDGAQVIFQAALSRGNLLGHADFLVRVGEIGRAHV